MLSSSCSRHDIEHRVKATFAFMLCFDLKKQIVKNEKKHLRSENPLRSLLIFCSDFQSGGERGCSESVSCMT